MQRRALAASRRVVTYRFSGAIVASSFPGVQVGDRFFGRLRYRAVKRKPRTLGPCVADPDGFVDARIGAVQIRSTGPLEIYFLDAPSVLRVSLSAGRLQPGLPLIAAAGELLLSRAPRFRGPAAMLDPDRYATRRLTLASADLPGFADGTLDTLYPLAGGG